MANTPKPDKIKCGGNVYKINWLSDYRTTTDCYGETNHVKKQITIDDTFEAVKTLIHESLHVVEEFTATRMGEDKVRSLEELIYMLFVDNPKLFKWILDQVKG